MFTGSAFAEWGTRALKIAARILLLSLVFFLGRTTATSGEPLGDGIVAYTTGDYATAMKIFRSWADQGNQDALTALGVMYVKGQGVEQDYTLALALFNRAVIAGSADAEAELGNMYRNGYGIPQDYDEAIARYCDSIQKGSVRGENYLGEAYASGEGVVKDYDQAHQLFQDAAQKGLTVAVVNLGNLYYLGRGVPKDLGTALRYYEAAAADNSPEAQNNLELMYQKGIGVAQDPARALSLFKSSAILGESAGAYNAGWAYENGLGTNQDFRQAYAWYDIGAHLGGTFSAKRRDLMSTHLSPDEIQQAKQEEATVSQEGVPLSGGGSSTNTQSNETDSWKLWIGHLPSDRINGTTLLDAIQANEKVRTILGGEAITKIANMGVSAPTTQELGWMTIWACKPHACDTNHFALELNITTGEMVICIRFDMPDWNFQQLIWGGTAYPTRQRTMTLGEGDDGCRWDQSSGSPNWKLHWRRSANPRLIQLRKLPRIHLSWHNKPGKSQLLAADSMSPIQHCYSPTTTWSRGAHQSQLRERPPPSSLWIRKMTWLYFLRHHDLVLSPICE